MLPTTFNGKLFFTCIIIFIIYLMIAMSSDISLEKDTMIGYGIGTALSVALSVITYRWIICPCNV